MKIVDDVEVFEPSECYFAVIDNPEYLGMENSMVIAITPIFYWNENLCLDDGFGCHSLSKEINDKLEIAGIWEACESTWCSDKSENDIKTVMFNLGFVESKELYEIMIRN
jgi:hypothetical protein